MQKLEIYITSLVNSDSEIHVIIYVYSLKSTFLNENFLGQASQGQLPKKNLLRQTFLKSKLLTMFVEARLEIHASQRENQCRLSPNFNLFSRKRP